MSTTPDTRQIPDSVLQTAIDEAVQEMRHTHAATIGSILLCHPLGRPSLCWPAEAAASAVLAAFGQTTLEAGIKRMESVPTDDLYFDYSHAVGGVSEGINAVRARLIAAAKEGQAPCQTIGINGLTADETEQTASVAGLSQPSEIPWIEWNGGECPLKDEEVKEWEWKSRAGFTTREVARPQSFRWQNDGSVEPRCAEYDIIAYRVTKWREGQPAAVDWRARAEKAEARIVWLEAQNERQANDMQDVAHRLGVFADDVGTGSVKNAASFKSSEIHRLNAALQKAEAELADSANALTYISETLDAMGIPSVTAAGDGPGSIGIEQRMDLALRELEAKALPQLRPLSEAGPVPEGCVRIRAWTYEGTFRVSTLEDLGDTHFADIRLPPPPPAAFGRKIPSGHQESPHTTLLPSLGEAQDGVRSFRSILPVHS